MSARRAAAGLERAAARPRLALLPTAIAGALACPWAHAQPAAPAEPAPVVQQVEIRGENTDAEQRRREPVAKTVYGRDEIEKYGDTNVSDVLKRLPGINVTGGNPRLRGLGAGYTLILINGEPAPPGFSLDNLSPSQVERIEVTKGPTAEHSAQAVAGTINIILREAPKQRQRELRVGLGQHQGKAGYSVNGTYGDRFGALSLSLPASAYRWRGGSWAHVERHTLDSSGLPQHLVAVTPDRYWGHGLNLSPRLSWKFNESDTLNSQTIVQSHRFHNAGRTLTDVLEGAAPVSVDDDWFNRGRWQMIRSNLEWVRRWSDGSRIDLKAGAQASRSEYRTDVDGRDEQGAHSLTRVSEGRNRERNLTSAGKYLRPLFEQHTLALGWDVERKRRFEQRSVTENGVSQLVGFDGEPFEAEVRRVAVYAQDEWGLSAQWSTYLGIRAERIESSSVGLADPVAHHTQVITPLWHLNYKLDPRGKDQIRASLTRSFKAPDLGALLARPSINSNYPVDRPNPQLSPDRVGNPRLEPELATGLDLSIERYLPGGGLVSAGLFHRRIRGLIRNVVSLEAVTWSPVTRWVSRPANLSGATSTGVEFEAKGKIGDWLPAWFDPATALNVRASLSVYRSSVADIPGPDNRLESQQPWAMTMGFDHVVKGTPLTYGASMAVSPAYAVQQTLDQQSWSGRTRSLDAYVLWAFDKTTVLRVAGNSLLPIEMRNRTRVVSADGLGQSSETHRFSRSQVNASLTVKF